MNFQTREAQAEENSWSKIDSTEVAPKIEQKIFEDDINDKMVLYREETDKEVQISSTRNSGDFLFTKMTKESVMDREIQKVIEEEADLTESKANMLIGDVKVVFEQVEELLDSASWQQIFQHCLQNF